MPVAFVAAIVSGARPVYVKAPSFVELERAIWLTLMARE
jgi:hypothetical protein